MRSSARENLELFCKLYGLLGTPAPRRCSSRCGCAGAAGRKVKTFSTGMRQRLLLARALLNQPRVLFLDEPTRGLDPRSARELRDAVTSLAADGATIFLTTHDMTEADELCRRVAFLADGRIVALDTPRDAQARPARRRPRGRRRARRRRRGAPGARRAGRGRAAARADRRGSGCARSIRASRRSPTCSSRSRVRSLRGRVMSPRRILAILVKDVREAWRDGRILVLLLLPIGVGVVSTLLNEETLPTTRVAVVDQQDGAVTRELRRLAGTSAKLELTRARDAAAARRLVADEEVDLAVVVAPSGAPRAEILVGAGASPTARSLVELAPIALARAAGQDPPARPPVLVVAPADQIARRDHRAELRRAVHDPAVRDLRRADGRADADRRGDRVGHVRRAAARRDGPGDPRRQGARGLPLRRGGRRPHGRADRARRCTTRCCSAPRCSP